MATKEQKKKKNGAGARKARAEKKSVPEIPLQYAPGFPVVGVGASAGGLEALKEFFENVPCDVGMAFIVIVHQHPDHTSLLPDLLGKVAKITVLQAVQSVTLEPNCVYVAPPGHPLTIENGVVSLVDSHDWRGPPLPVDLLFRSLAADLGRRAICVILSGTGSDGTLGLKAIKAGGGLAIAQSPATAGFAGMPSSAIETGMVDHVLAPALMARQLIEYAGGAYLENRPAIAEQNNLSAELFRRVLFLLKSRTSNDFSSYKATTLNRRIERRMRVHQIKDQQEYVRFLEENPHELDTLFKELLIRVTNFFRDTEAFEALAGKALLDMLLKIPQHGAFRVWVPACSSGEEVYSIAILLRECMDKIEKHFDVQIFGTDLDSQAISAARSGRYPAEIKSDVSADRLKRWFTHEGNGYRVCSAVREITVFAVHNVIKDPPFSKVNLISCRNMLIYMKPDLQQQLLSLFHYALDPEGLLFLGPSETISGSQDLFEVVDGKWKIFRRQARTRTSWPPTRPCHPAQGNAKMSQYTAPAAELESGKSLVPLVEQYLLTQFCPTSVVVVNERGDIMHIRGKTGAYLEPAEGSPRMNVLDMARKGLKGKLISALRQAVLSEDESVVVRNQAHLEINGENSQVELAVGRPLDPEALRGLFIITFRSSPDAAAEHLQKDSTTGDLVDNASELSEELRYTKESLQSTIEELEASNEELRSSNEELQSANEEMQSAAEELETSKEEMQSLNEELSTVNAELQSKNEDLMGANDDTQNLLNSTDIATIFLDLELNIKRFTDRAIGLIKLIRSDVGRPIGDLVSNLKYPVLERDCRAVLDTLVPKEGEVETEDGLWYAMRIIPYRTADNRINGLVLTFSNITQMKQGERAAQAMQAYFESIVQTVREPLIVLDDAQQILTCNHSFSRTFGISAEAARGKSIYKLGRRQWNVAELRRLLEEILPQQTTIENFQIATKFPKLGYRVFELNARRLEAPREQEAKILLAMEDITGTDRVKTQRDGDEKG